MQHYTKTQIVSSALDFDSMKPGQWFQWAGNEGTRQGRGQWLGKTRAGVDAVRYQGGAFGKPADCERNFLLRKWAKANGSK
jgi:hypothetical protein